MKKVIDIDGQIVRGAVKTETGSINFDDKNKFKAYLAQKENALNRKTEVDELRQQINVLMELLKQKDKNG